MVMFAFMLGCTGSTYMVGLAFAVALHVAGGRNERP